MQKGALLTISVPFGVSATIRICPKNQCLPFAGYFLFGVFRDPLFVYLFDIYVKHVHKENLQ